MKRNYSQWLVKNKNLIISFIERVSSEVLQKNKRLFFTVVCNAEYIFNPERKKNTHTFNVH